MRTGKIVVVGAGPAGLMAAGQAAETGASPVLVIEKMPQPALKLRITGKGRCNLTNIASLPDFIEHFGKNGNFLRQAFSQFFSDDLIGFFRNLGMKTVTERGGRVFPAGNQAKLVVSALVNWVSGKANIKTNCAVKGFILEGDRIAAVEIIKRKSAGTERIAASQVILATGGASYPGTGSTGDGYRLAAAVGHTIVPIRPALVPLETAGNIAARLQGLSLRNVSVRVFIEAKKKAEAFGEMIFTHFGVSGPVILSLSKKCVDALQRNQSVTIAIDLKPALEEKKLDQRLLRDIEKYSKKRFKNFLKGLLPAKLIPVCIDMTRIQSEKPVHQINSEERKRLRCWLKDFRLEVVGYRPFEEAIVTAGGVSLKEVDPRTMASRLVKNLYLAGEVLDIDADTGGYNLQAAFSTGWLAGRSAARACRHIG